VKNLGEGKCSGGTPAEYSRI